MAGKIGNRPLRTSRVGDGEHGKGGLWLWCSRESVDCRHGRAPLVIPQPSMCSESSDSDEIEHAQDDESGDDDPKGKGVIESKGQGRGWGRGKRTTNSGAGGGRAPTRARK